MQTWVKNLIIGIVLAIIFSVGGYFLYPKLNETTTIPPNQENTINTTAQIPQEESAAPEVKEPVVLVPKKEASIPPPEPPLPIGTDRFNVSLTDTNEEIADNIMQAGFITDTKNFLDLLNKEKIAVSPGAYKLSKEMTEI